ncbi:MAG: UDP-glucose--hexose-1-phosphate uridylyltransferase [Gammaproteobacteria bacterium]|nr:UDP-glucose--hexose-1-phosphate uridylyltransferase [Gammaproteobacteria bacterium]
MMDISNSPHRRYNPLKGEWVLVSPHRAMRPWQGQQESVPLENKLAFDPDCYLCPGNTRISGKKNPAYEQTYVFSNDSSALFPDAEFHVKNKPLLLQAEKAVGTTRVICFSPKHDLTLADLSVPELTTVINTMVDQVEELKQKYTWIQIFENKGEIMGCSSPHPHGQIWASEHIPNEAMREETHQSAYYNTHGKPLLLDYAELEMQQNERIVCENEDWLVVVPFWATWPFETLLLPKFQVQHLPGLSPKQIQSLAKILQILLAKYDNLFNVSFPYSMGWHGAPYNGKANEHWQFHAHFYPPLLRSASIKKFMVGYEMLAEAQRDLTAEQAAERLRELPDTKQKGAA